jgi:outer membrane lipoprotein SlyB
MDRVMGRSVIGLCGGFGMLVGGFVPSIWGASQFSLASIVFSVFGGVAGALIGARMSEV